MRLVILALDVCQMEMSRESVLVFVYFLVSVWGIIPLICILGECSFVLLKFGLEFIGDFASTFGVLLNLSPV